MIFAETSGIMSSVYDMIIWDMQYNVFVCCLLLHVELLNVLQVI